MYKGNHYVLLCGGCIGLLLGILLFVRTDTTLLLLMVLAGLACVSYGLLSMLAIPIDGTAWVRRLLSGVIGISTGLVILQNSVASTQVLTSALAIIVGILMALSKRQSRISATANPVPIQGHLMRRLVTQSHNWETTPWLS